MSDFNITRNLIRMNAEMNAKGGYRNEACSRFKNIGVLKSALFAIKHLSLAILKIPSAPFANCCDYLKKNIKISAGSYQDHLIEAIKNIALVILSPISIVSPQLMNLICEKLFPETKEPEPSSEINLPNAKPIVPPSIIKPVMNISKKEFYAECIPLILTNDLNIDAKDAKEITKKAYHELIKNPVVLNTRITSYPGIPHVEMIASLANKTFIAQTDKLLGEGAFKKVYDGYAFTYNPDSVNSPKVAITAVAILRCQSAFMNPLEENDIAAKFNSKYVVKKSLTTFQVGNDCILVSDKLPFFFVNVFPKNGARTVEGFLPSNPKNIYPNLPYTFKDLIRGVKGAAKGLAAIHKENYMHRDIKPDNIAIQQNGKGTVVDLGFVIEAGKDHDLGFTPWYIPPESTDANNWKKNSQTIEGDLWALGVSLFEIFHPTHKSPYHGDSENEILKALLEIKKDPQKFEDNLLVGWLPKNDAEVQLQTLIAQLISVDPKKRGTALEAAKALKLIQSMA